MDTLPGTGEVSLEQRTVSSSNTRYFGPYSLHRSKSPTVPGFGASVENSGNRDGRSRPDRIPDTPPQKIETEGNGCRRKRGSWRSETKAIATKVKIVRKADCNTRV